MSKLFYLAAKGNMPQLEQKWVTLKQLFFFITTNDQLFKVVCFQNTIEKLLKDFSHSAQVIWISTSNFHFLWIIKIKLKFNESNWSLSRFLPSVSNDGLFFFANKFLMCNELSKETNLGRFFFSPDGGLESKISNKNPWPTFWLLLVDLNVFQGVLKTLMF